MFDDKPQSRLQALCARLLIASLLCTGVAIIPGCEEDSDLEDAGEEIEDAAEDVGDDIEDAFD